MIEPKIKTGADLKNLRLRFKLSQHDLVKFGFTQARISEWENGKPLSLTMQWAFTGLFLMLERDPKNVKNEVKP